MSFDSDLARWQSITTDAKEQQHADAIAIDAAVDQRAERVKQEAIQRVLLNQCPKCGTDAGPHSLVCHCYRCRDAKAAR